MITIKDLAKQLDVSYEAVRQQVKRYADRELEGHIVAAGKVQYLDEFAVEFLRSKRNLSPVVLVQQDRDAAYEQIEQENKALLVKVAAQADKISELSEWKSENALLLAEAKNTQRLLQAAEERAHTAEGALDIAIAEKLDAIEAKKVIQEQLAGAEQRARAAEDVAEAAGQEADRAKADAAELQAKLERLANAGWFERRRILKDLKNGGQHGKG